MVYAWTSITHSQVRLGDALCGTNKDMLQKRPPAPQQLADVVKGKVPKNSVVKVMAMPENHPLNQCKQETRDYLDALTTNLPAHHVSFSEVGTLTPQEAADFDLCEMVRAPVFVRGKAGFAALAEGLRDFAHKATVSDLAGLDAAFVGQRERDNWATIGD